MSDTLSLKPLALEQVAKATQVFQQSPPKFGHDILPYFSFNYLNLNNGSYGALPKIVTEICEALTATQEENPDYYYRRWFQNPLIEVRGLIAKLVGVSDINEIVMVPNASSGIAVVLRNIIWNSGDIIVRTNITYPTVTKTIQYIHDVTDGVEISTFELKFPTTRQAILEGWKKHIDNLVKQNPNIASGKNKFVAVIDAICWNPGVAMPWKEMVKICKDTGNLDHLTIIDGAHSVGQEPINLPDSGANFFISNCHKWLNAKRGSAFLWMPNISQSIMLSTFPTSGSYLSPGPDRPPNNIIAQFEYNGTIDYTPSLSVKYALQWREWVGGEAAIQEYCHKLAIEGGKVLAKTMNTKVMDPDGEFTLAMVNVLMPLPEDITEFYDASISTAFTNKLFARNMFAVTYWHGKKWWTRASAQIWNELQDFDILGKAFVSICGEIIEEHQNAKIPQDHKAESFHSYLHNPVRGALAYDTNSGHGLPVTSTKLVPVGYHTHLASIRP